MFGFVLTGAQFRLPSEEVKGGGKKGKHNGPLSHFDDWVSVGGGGGCGTHDEHKNKTAATSDGTLCSNVQE